MKKLFLALTLCLLATLARANVVFVGTNANTSGASLAVTTPVTIPAGATIVVLVNERSATSNVIGGSLTDSVGNSYLATLAQSSYGTGTAGFCRLVGATNINSLSSGQAITYSKRTSGDVTAMSVLYIDNTITAPNDAAFANTNTGTASIIISGSAAPSQAGEVIIAGLCAFGSSTTFTNDPKFTTPFNEASSGSASTDARVNGGFYINQGTLNVSYQPTLTLASNWVALILAYKATTGAGTLATMGAGQ